MRRNLSMNAGISSVGAPLHASMSQTWCPSKANSTMKSPVRATSAVARIVPSLRSALSKKASMSSLVISPVPLSMSRHTPCRSLATDSPPDDASLLMYLLSVSWSILLSE